MTFAIHVEGLGKQYSIGARGPQRDLRETLSAALAAPWRRQRTSGNGANAAADNLIWALKDVSFEVTMGQAVGVIGNNGSGKSTLLKILSRIVEPTEGYADIRGRVGSLLEVGSGFNFELTGRENIFLSGAILGMHRREIERKLDEIVAFAGVQKFIDTPVKHYSTGMYMRLAFAVAAHLETEILLVDEVLAVGDGEFQKKCLAKMEDVAQHGRTIFLVSHNMVAVQTLCDQVMWLQDGRIKAQGPSSEVVAQYLGTQATATRTEQVWAEPTYAPGNDQVRLHAVSIRPDGANFNELMTLHTPLRVDIEYWNLQPGAYLSAGIHVHKESEVLAFTSLPIYETSWRGRACPVGLFRSTCWIPANLLNTGTYGIQLVFIEREATVSFSLKNALVFDVHESTRGGAWFGEWGGVVRPELEWTTELLEPVALSTAGAEAILGAGDG
jgi:lipopolysaccharide transport system ATP-binding protein